MDFLCNVLGMFSKINKHGINIILTIAIFCVLLALVSSVASCVALFIFGFTIYFFRDPERITHLEKGAIIAPADGVITSIAEVDIPEKFGIEGGAIKISIFLSIFDIHVTRYPCNATVQEIIYSPGKFINVSKEKESEDNENNSVVLQDEMYNKIIVTQIAGLIARRIVCDAKEKDVAKCGERFGVIKFGSRVNIYLPTHFKLMVALKQKVVSGETLLAIADEECLMNYINKLNNFIKPDEQE